MPLRKILTNIALAKAKDTNKKKTQILSPILNSLIIFQPNKRMDTVIL
jgi:hypothetical protein